MSSFFDKKPASETPWTKKLWIYDLRTIRTSPLRPARAPDASPAGRWRSFDYDELISRDKASLDIFWLKDQSLEDSDNLPEPGIIAREIVDDLEAALEQFRLIAEDLGEEA